MHRLLTAAAALAAAPALAEPPSGADPARAAAAPLRSALVRDIAETESLLATLQTLRTAIEASGDPSLSVDPAACDGGPVLRALCAETPESVR